MLRRRLEKIWFYARWGAAWLNLRRLRLRRLLHEPVKRLIWAPVILAVWPLIWYDKRQRYLHNKPDEWFWADLFLTGRGIYIMARGRFLWEKRSKWPE